MKSKYEYFMIGVGFHAAVNSLIQDSYGKYGYMLHVWLGWVDSSITVPAAIVLATMCFLSLMLGQE